jgi:hypothetical protein
MHCQSISHDGDELGMYFVLMLLVISLELVKLDEHHGLFRIEMPSKRLADVRNEIDHDRQRLGGEGKVLGRDILQAGRAHRTCAENDLTCSRIKLLQHRESDDWRIRQKERKKKRTLRNSITLLIASVVRREMFITTRI